MKIRKLILTASIGTACLAAAAGVAWACTPGSSLDPIAPASGTAPGAQMTVSGRNFQPGIPVEIRWNSTDGPVVGTAPGPEFVAQATVPSGASVGVHYVVAMQKDPSGAVVSKMTETFQVIKGVVRAPVSGGAISSPPQRVPSDLWSGFEKGSAAPSGGASQEARPAGSRSELVAGLAAAGLAVGLFSFGGLILVRGSSASRSKT